MNLNAKQYHSTRPLNTAWYEPAYPHRVHSTSTDASGPCASTPCSDCGTAYRLCEQWINVSIRANAEVITNYCDLCVPYTGE